MGNTVKTNRSDEMLKSLVAQIASQSVAIFLQQKMEAQDARPSDAETYAYVAELEEELRLKIAECQVLEAKLADTERRRLALSKSVSNVAIDNGQLKDRVTFLESELADSGLYHYENGDFVRGKSCKLA
jgi:septal ring factor EnvC (AmiA/AmiB activator)